MIHDAAFLVGFLEKSTGKFLGAEIFSEPTPTVGLKIFPFTLVSTSGHDYQEGKDRLNAILDMPEWAWVLPHISRPRR
jgi:hypothetical protein